jgi:hypothetical protein
MAYSIFDIVKILPQTNCGECRFPTCMAFAIAVIKNGEPLENCLYLPKEAEAIAGALKEQQRVGKGSSREALEAAKSVMQNKVMPLDFRSLAAGLDATYGEDDGNIYLAISYFGKPVKIFKDHILYPTGMDTDPWDEIFLYNYVCSQGNAPATGDWISFNELPGAVSQTLTLNLAQFNMTDWDEKKVANLRQGAEKIGAQPVLIDTSADIAFVLTPLSRIPILLLYYRAEPEEGTEAQLQFLFDASVGSYLDFEGAFFLINRIKGMLAG